jgi:hypothetical protein
MSWLLGTEPEEGAEVEQEERGASRLPKWFSGAAADTSREKSNELGGKESIDES